MRRLLAVTAGAFASAAFLAVNAGAATQSGDTCTASGNGTTYTLNIAVPSGAQQFGFAFGAPGATVTNAVIPGTNGSFSSQKLAPNTTGAWISDAPMTGAPDATLTVSGTATGAFTVVPAGASQSTYFSPVRCTLSTGGTASVAFTVEPQVTYSASAGTWHLVVAVPGAGTVSARQLEPTTGTGSSKSVTAKSLVQTRKITRMTAGKATLTLRATPSGQTDLKKTGAIKLKLHVTFDAQSGKSANKLVSLTLKK
jgi:hypothetical protein